MNYDRPDLLDRLASEYVLGTLRGRARRRFEQIQARLPAARFAVAAWQARLARLAQPVPRVNPPARVWEAIEARMTSPAERAAAAARAPGGWLGRLFKPALGFALGAVLTTGLVLLNPQTFVTLEGLAQREQALPQSYVGLLTDKDNQPTLLVSSTRHGTRVTVKFLRPVEVPPGKVIQVWALPRDAAPFPLGVAAPAAPPKSTTFELSASSEKLLSAVPRLGVSLEDSPVTGAAAAAPDLVLSGFCVKLW
jgi:anti-sigma-K factor RskA